MQNHSQSVQLAMFFRALARITSQKLMITAGIALLAGLPMKRIECTGDSVNSCCLSSNLRQYFPLVLKEYHQIAEVLAILSRLSHLLNRFLDIGHAYIFTCVVFTFLKQSAEKNKRRRLCEGCKVCIVGAFCLLAVVTSYVGQQISCIYGSPTLYRLAWYQLDVAVLLYDVAFLLMATWFVVAVFWVEDRMRNSVSMLIRRTLASGVLLAQVTGMLYRYTGMVIAPNPSFALLLGTAYLVSPMNLFLTLLTVYHTKEEI